MTARRSYRKNIYSAGDALDHIKSESGKHFAPDLVKVFIDAKIGKAEKRK
jgi:HD-GYP domain-containing protein (c-di-GMP phosphodiesterase class II)